MVWYNEIDPYPAAWLRALGERDLIPHGPVDERSIRDLRPEDVPDGQCHFFAGLGGWPAALRLAGWPDDVPVWTGSCPCQPFSVAGRRKGVADDRHLWPDWFRLISVRRPPVVFGEQVASPDGLRWLDLVLADLEGAGYAVGAADLCAAGVGAPHLRQRLFFCAVDLALVEPSVREVGLPGLARVAGVPVADALGVGAGGRPGPDPREARGGGGEAWEQRLWTDAGSGGGLPSTLADDDDAGRGIVGRAGLPDHGYAPRGDDADGRSALVRGADAEGSRCDGEIAEERRLDFASKAGFWDDCSWVKCLDGKSRPFEPGSFPLADGVPARVGRLRAYGNAIVPQAAATFIRAVVDVMDVE